MHRLFSWTADAVGCWARLVVGVCSPFQKIDHDKSMVDYSAKCAPAFAPAHTIPIDIHHRHALTCDLRIPNPAWFRDSTDLFFHFFLSQPGRKACFYFGPLVNDQGLLFRGSWLRWLIQWLGSRIALGYEAGVHGPSRLRSPLRGLCSLLGGLIPPTTVWQ